MARPLHLECRERYTPQEFVTHVIEPVLCALPSISFSRAAAQLLLGTALHESMGLKHRRQMGGGPARSFFQMEPATHDDIWDNYLKYRSKLAGEVEAVLADKTQKHYELEFNDHYAAAMARVHYYRVPEAMPGFNDISSQALYWKKHYNTAKGKGTTAKYLKDWTAHGGPGVTFVPSC
jgi:hypothetical protein